ncbi:MAG: homoserine O-succinyltransferase [Ardenticatenaceae bacterium]|nr:homoserine O-succinyltransferase [Ardenticatenaceae bacterium]
MPLVNHIPLPTFDRLRRKGHEVLSLEQAVRQDIRELHIGFLNMMPDAALQVTEEQFMRLVGNSNQIAQFFVHPFSVPGLPRSAETQTYIDTYYNTFEQLQAEGLDALIITGANVANPSLDQEPFWEPLMQVIGWATANVTSVLCSCLATHALVKYLYHIERQGLPRKRWGVYEHRITSVPHPLLRGINTRFDVPHSRYNEITRRQLQEAGLTILVESRDGDVHMATSPDQFRIVFFQGHPEYDYNSLLKEYKREVNRFINNDREDYPPHPQNYFPPPAAAIADAYEQTVVRAKARHTLIPSFPEELIEAHLDNTWGDTGKAIFNNWLGLVYQLTDLDRKRPFISGIDPHDPLGLRKRD